MNKLSFLFYAERFGGYERRMLRFIEWLLKNTNVHILVFCNDFIINHYSTEFDFLNNKEKYNISIVKLELSYDSLKNKFLFIFKLYYHLIINSSDFDILIVGSGVAKFISGYSIFKKTIVNIVQTEYLTKKTNIIFKLLNYILYFILFSGAYKISFLNPSVYKKSLKRYSFINNKKISIPPCSFIKHSDKSLKQINKNNIIMWMGSFNRNKQPMLLLEAVNEIKELIRIKKYSVEFYGKGKLEKQMNNYINKYKLNDIIKLKFTKNTSKVLKEASFFVSSQKLTNYPSQVLLEAMDNFCIPIATRTPDTDLLVNVHNGFLFSTKNELVNILTKLINTPEEDLTTLRKKSKEKSMDHTLDRFADYYMNELLSCLKINK